MKIKIITATVFAASFLLAACGDSNEKLARQVCEEQMNKDPRASSLSPAEKDLALKMCVDLATQAIRNGMR